MEIEYFEDYLSRHLEEKKSTNNRYSLRAMAKTLSIEPSMLSKIIRKRYKLNSAIIEKLGQRLNLDARQIQQFCKRNQKLVDEQQFAVMDPTVYAQLSNWESTVVLRSFDLQSTWNPQSLAEKLDCSVEKIESICALLVKNKLIKKNESSQYVRLKEQYLIPNKVEQAAINRELTKEMILQAHKSVDKNKPDERIHVNAVSSMSRRSYKLIQPKIHQLVMEIARLAAEDKGREDCITVLNINYFPVLKK